MDETSLFTIPEGGVSIKNLKVSEDIYSIVEVSAPAGYVITNDTPITFKVSGGNITDEHHVEGVSYEPATKDFTIPNQPGAALPSTGGPGTHLFTLPGLILIAIAGLMLRRRYKAI